MIDVLVRREKAQRKCVIKQEINFQYFKKGVENSKTILKSQQRFQNETNNVFTETIVKEHNPDWWQIPDHS